MLAVIGAQYGSEGKGVIVSAIADKFSMHVRVGSPNAGHTFFAFGEKHVMQSIPCGWMNPKAVICIGRGALLNMAQLMKEINHVKRFFPDFLQRLLIDCKAGVLDERFHQQEGGVNGEMHKRIGSTGEGVGPARIARINRNSDEFYHFGDIAAQYGLEGCTVDNTPAIIAHYQDTGHNILLEGTQGSALSLIHGPWPYVTSIDTNAAQILAEIGVAPNRLTNVMLVARTYPIRVAGNSGPMYKEITWEEVSRLAGRLVEEKTTVTKKVRRVALWDPNLIKQAVLLNSPTCLALTFTDYVDPALYGTKSIEDVMNSGLLMQFISKQVYPACPKTPIYMVGTGGPEFSTVVVNEDALQI